MIQPDLRKSFAHATALISFTMVETLMKIDKLPLECRTTDRLLAYFEDFGKEAASRLSGPGSAFARQAIDSVVEAVREGQFDDDFQAFINPTG